MRRCSFSPYARHARFFLGFLMVTLVMGVSACDPAKTKPAPLSVEDENKRNFGKVFGDDFLLFGGPAKPQRDETALGNANAYLWQATLDTLSFMPLQTVDGVGGVIVTDWYTPTKTPHERLKATVRILGKQLRADGVKVQLNKQRRLNTGQWVDVASDAETQQALTGIILSRARQLRANGLTQ